VGKNLPVPSAKTSKTVAPSEQPNTVVMWFRRDLRVEANTALRAAIESACAEDATLLPIFILDPKLVASSGSNRLAFLYEALQSLRDSGVPLVVLEGTPRAVLTDLVQSHRVVKVICAYDYAPTGVRRDTEIKTVLKSMGVSIEQVGSPYAVAPGTVRKGDGTPFKVFTPFKRAWEQHLNAALDDPIPTVNLAKVPWQHGAGPETAIPARPVTAAKDLPKASEAAAHERLQHFIEHNLHAYDSMRNDPAADATSRLSADLKFGLLHPIQIAPFLQVGRVGADVFRSELGWREFYADVLWHRPETSKRAYNPAMEDIEVDTGPEADELFSAWCEGRTGFPFIDAGMRQLRDTGWMHNRVRMATASFLVKDLHIDWRRGAAWFMELLVDGDVASNQHGWQWTAGTGTDASPYYRVFNPITQGKKFDPTGAYVRKYVPELANLSDKEIHEPWLVGGGGLFGGQTDYPAPIVDHAAERVEALARYAAAKLPAEN
jgi:deoxyribodipyrimidine photo-lyase